MNKNIIIYGSVILVLLIVLAGGIILIQLFYGSNNTAPSGGFFGFGSAVSVAPNGNDGGTNTPQQGSDMSQRVFKISDGPIAGAVFIQNINPTTTVARYTKADNGHVAEIALDVQGSVTRPISNITIPGIEVAFWTSNGSSTVMQYRDSGVLKSVFMSFDGNATGTASTTPSRVRFLPNNITSVAISPNDTQLAYVLPNTNKGVDGYVAAIDGTNPKFLFSLPIGQTILSWPSVDTLLAQMKSAVGVPGIAHTINARTGTLSPLLYTVGLSVTANKAFTKVVYQTSSDSASKTYSHDIATGKDAPLANNPLPEKCTWSTFQVTDVFCALPLEGTGPTYMDAWHQGLVPSADTIVNIDSNTGIGSVITIPGDGGSTASIEQIILSKDGRYLMYITRGDQSLWGVRLSN